MRFDEIDSMTQDDVTVSLRRDVWRRMWDVFVYLLCLFTLSLVYWTLIMSNSSSFLVCGLACVRRYMRLYIMCTYVCVYSCHQTFLHSRHPGRSFPCHSVSVMSTSRSWKWRGRCVDVGGTACACGLGVPLTFLGFP